MRLVLLALACATPPDSADTSEEPMPPEGGTAGCLASEPLADGEHTAMVDGLERRFAVRLPQGYSADRAWPVVYALHGNGTGLFYWDLEGTPQDIRTVFRDDAILVIPEAIDQQWRDYDADESTWPGRIEQELAFFDWLHAHTNDNLCAQQDGAFAMGFSGGGSFSFALACQRDWVRGIAVGGSVLYVDPATCTHTPAAWVTIGQGELADGRLAYRDTMAERAGCEAIAEEPVLADDADRACHVYTGCAEQTPVTYCTHPRGHVWPDFGSEAARVFFDAVPR